MKILIMFLLWLNIINIAIADETLVFIRHGEKPNGGLGQLNCKGFNRSLALPNVLIEKFGMPSALFAPNPSELKTDNGLKYSYIRPLSTIEPTAIKLNIPVNVQYSFEDIVSLEKELLSEKYREKIIFISWEHHLAEKMVKEIMVNINKQVVTNIPNWENDDFDSIYVIKIKEYTDGKIANFIIEHQDLNNVKESCQF
jgi:hypothetical protein